MPNWSVTINILEQGHLYFFYKPKKYVGEVKGLQDIGRFYLVMDPADSGLRFLVLGPKRMPMAGDGTERAWGFIEKVGGRGFEVLPQNAGLPSRKGQARPAGEALYALVAHGSHTHLVYMLELPKRIGEVQRVLNIQQSGNYIIVTKQPWTQYGTVRSRTYLPANPPSLLDKERTNVLLIGVDEAPASLGVSIDKEKESEATADIFRQLKVNKHRHPIQPLMTGRWQ
jgi:hypothetical protein